MTSHFLDFSIRTGTSGKVSYGDSDRVKVSLSNEHSLSQEVPFKFIPFSEKVTFQRKFMVFSKIFSAQEKEQKKLHKVVSTK